MRRMVAPPVMYNPSPLPSFPPSYPHPPQSYYPNYLPYPSKPVPPPSPPPPIFTPAYPTPPDFDSFQNLSPELYYLLKETANVAVDEAFNRILEGDVDGKK